MKSARNTVYLVTAGTGIVRHVRIPRGVVALFWALAMAATFGLVRSVYFVVQYGYDKFQLYDELGNNRDLQEQITALRRLAAQYHARMSNLVAFEDDARTKFGMNMISEDVRLAGVGGRPTLEQRICALLEDPKVRDADALREKFAGLLRQTRIQKTTFSRMGSHVSMQHDRWAQRPSVWPVHGRITSGYGRRMHPFFGRVMFHDGVDIANKEWTPVRATADGIVSYVGWRGDYGNTVRISHRGSGFTTGYAHLAQSSVVDGQVVERGELVGYLGSSGRSTGPHLHYEVRKLGRHVDPMRFILPTDTMIE